jgi:hypothetical protein
VVQVLEHPALSNDIPHALGSHNYAPRSDSVVYGEWGGMLTLIFADILQGEGQCSILPLYDSNLPKGTLAYDTKESKVVQVDYERVELANQNPFG